MSVAESLKSRGQSAWSWRAAVWTRLVSVCRTCCRMLTGWRKMLDLNDDSPPLCQQQGWLSSQSPPPPPPWIIERVTPARPPWVPPESELYQGEPGEREDDPELQP